MKKLATKKYFLLLGLFFIFSFLFANSALASAGVNVFNISQTSTKFKITGVSAGTKIEVDIKNKPGTPSYANGESATVDQSIFITDSFDNLTKGGSYVVVVTDLTSSNQLATNSFTTPGATSLAYANLTKTSVTLKASGYNPDQNLTFRVANSGSTAYYLQSHQVAADAIGNATLDFSGLSAGGSYKGEVLVGSTLDKTVSFQTTSSSQGGGICGNGTKETSESCDGADLAGQTCANQGFSGGTLGCTSTCVFDTSSCSSGLAPGWYYELNDSSGTRTIGPNTSDGCQNDLDAEAATSGVLITLQCYEVTTSNSNNGNNGGGGNNSSPPPTIPGWYYDVSFGPYSATDCQNKSDLATANGDFITQQCYEVPGAGSGSKLSSVNSVSDWFYDTTVGGASATSGSCQDSLDTAVSSGALVTQTCYQVQAQNNNQGGGGNPGNGNTVTPSSGSASSTYNAIYTLLSPLPQIGGFNGKTFDTTGGLQTYLQLIFQLLIGIAGLLAVIMIVIGGIEYMSTDAISGKEEGKERVTQAILGLIIALGAWLLLNTINPEIVGSGIILGNQTIQIKDQTYPLTAGGGENGLPTVSSNINTYDTMLSTAAAANSLDCTLLKAFMLTESAGKPAVVSSAGAVGLMQLLPSTAQALGVTGSLSDPQTNINAGAAYINKLYSTACNGSTSNSVCNVSNTKYVVASYNGGPKANTPSVTCPGITFWECAQNPGYAETRGYVQKVLGNYNTLNTKGWGC